MAVLTKNLVTVFTSWFDDIWIDEFINLKEPFMKHHSDTPHVGHSFDLMNKIDMWDEW